MEQDVIRSLSWYSLTYTSQLQSVRGKTWLSFGTNFMTKCYQKRDNSNINHIKIVSATLASGYLNSEAQGITRWAFREEGTRLKSQYRWNSCPMVPSFQYISNWVSFVNKWHSIIFTNPHTDNRHVRYEIRNYWAP